MRSLVLILVTLMSILGTDRASPDEVIGIWQIVTSEEETEFITIGPEGSAIHSVQGLPDSNGAWRLENQHVIIVWDNGWTDVITPEAGSMTRRTYSPQSDRNQAPDTTSKMKRLEPKASGSKAASWGAGIILENCKG